MIGKVSVQASPSFSTWFNLLSSLFLFFAAETWDVSISSGGRFKKPLPIDFKLENEIIFSKITEIIDWKWEWLVFFLAASDQNLVFTDYGGSYVLGLLGNQRMRQSISLTHLTISPHHQHHHHHHQFKQHVVRSCGVWWHECTCSRKNPRHLVNIDFKSLPINIRSSLFAIQRHTTWLSQYGLCHQWSCGQSSINIYLRLLW